MAELYIIGEISNAEGFGSNSLFCRYTFQAGSNWRVISGYTEGQTITDTPLYEGPAVWTQPLDIYYKTKGIQGWPKVIVQVHCVDGTGRSWLVGYGVCSVPSTPGVHLLTLPCWTPEPSSVHLRLQQYFLGGTNQLITPDTLVTGKDRYRLKTNSSGCVKIKLEIILKDFKKFGVEYK